MYCICCKKNKVIPFDGINIDSNSQEEDLLWLRKEQFTNKPQTSNGSATTYQTIDNINISDGIIQRISAGYGSTHDTDVFIIAICDDCISKELSDGTLLYAGNYMYSDEKFTQSEIDKSKQNYRRRKNLDGLV